VQVPETEWECVVEGLELEYDAYVKPLRVNKVNIGMTENPKFEKIGDYWNEEIVVKIANLLHEYQDLFSTTFTEMKRIVWELGAMNIFIKLDVKLVRKISYILNLKHKEIVKENLDRMLEASITEPHHKVQMDNLDGSTI
jgi:hypothetical protein